MVFLFFLYFVLSMTLFFYPVYVYIFRQAAALVPVAEQESNVLSIDASKVRKLHWLDDDIIYNVP